MSNINDSFHYTRFDKIFAKSMHFEQNGAHSPPFSQSNTSSPCQAEIAIIMLKSTKRKKVPPIMHPKKDFSRQNLEQKRPVFLQCTQCSPYQRHEWPLLFLFEGKMTQPTKRRTPIMHSKMDFSWQNLEQK
jgi:hypothetical protein